MKTLAELKRKIVVGTHLKLTRHDWLEIKVIGNLGTEVLKSRALHVGQVRPVTLVQSNQIALETPGSTSGKSYLNWPKASNIRFTEHSVNGNTIEGFEIDLKADGKFSAIMAYEDVTAFVGTHCECNAAYNLTTGGYACAK